MTLSHIISDIMWWWRKSHPTLRKLPNWRRAADAYAIAKRRGCTQDIGRARKDMRKAVLDDLRRV
ncbi:hypothetical protein [Shinella pollutisoli]|uniref:Uncharacterized protein n=1 Tax=Shinella pollutisoli TaxID=2250594 RepID=A0ABV7DDM9_9HYPH|nr:hypothetical protein [Shinella pollutisoli]